MKHQSFYQLFSLDHVSITLIFIINLQMTTEGEFIIILLYYIILFYYYCIIILYNIILFDVLLKHSSQYSKSQIFSVEDSVHISITFQLNVVLVVIVNK